MKPFIAIPALLLATPAAAEELMLTCSMNSMSYLAVFIIDTENQIARRVDEAEERSGFVKVSDHAYEILLPGDETKYSAKASIMRYTGKIELEFGEAPFDENKSGNVHHSGSCDVTEPEKKF